MTMVKTTQFAGYDCVQLENDAVALWITQSVGPRIIGFARHDGANLFAHTPDVKEPCPSGGVYSLRGGHRLLYAPEDPRRTCLPDDAPVTITEIKNGVRVTQPVEVQTGIQKSLTITLPGQDARVVVDHALHNQGIWPVELAPWAITQVKVGGVAILPQATAPVDEYGVLPNRHIALWSYTSINSPHITWGDRFVFVKAAVKNGHLKIGFPNPIGWLGYAIEGALFVKHAAYQRDATYFDRDTSSQCYCNPDFLELETLGPRTMLGLDQTVTHRETWTLYDGVAFRPDEEATQELVDELGLTKEAEQA